MRPTHRRSDWIAAHPRIDWLAPVAILATWGLLWSFATPETGVRTTLYTATSSAAGIALAAATFACTLLYQSSSPSVQDVRDRFGPLLRANWRQILASLLLSTTLPVASILVDGWSSQAALGLTLLSMALLVVSFARVIFWIDLTVALEHVGSRIMTEQAIPFQDPRGAKPEDSSS